MDDPIFELYRGDDCSLRVVITDENKTPIDITGWAFQATLKISTEMPDDQATVQVDIPPVEGPSAQQGVVYVHLPREQTMHLIPAPHFFDLQRLYNDKVSTVVMGRVTVKPDVTRRTA